MQKTCCSWGNILRLGSAYAVFIIGAGFATGQEILQFFASYGVNGLLGAILGLIILSLTSCSVMAYGQDFNLNKPTNVFVIYCGRYIGKGFEIFTILFTFSVGVIMLSGASAVIQETYGLPSYLGYLGMGVLCTITALFGIKIVTNINSFSAPLLVGLTVVIGIISVISNFHGFAELPVLSDEIIAKQPSSTWYCSAALYISFNFTILPLFLLKLGKQANSKKEAVYSGIVGSVFLMATVFIVSFAILTDVNVAGLKDAPTIFLAENINANLGGIFSIITLIAMYTTAAPILLVIKDEALKYMDKKYNVIITVFLGILMTSGGILPFSWLVGVIYPFAGYIGLILIVGVIVRLFYKVES